MIFNSKRRFVAILMIILVVFTGSILGIIFFTTGSQTKKENQEMLKVFADSYDENGFPDETALNPTLAPDNSNTLSDSARRYQVSTFYAVAFNPDGSLKELMNNVPSTFSDETLVEYAKTLIENDNESGVLENVAYLITTEDDYILVSMMDTVVIDTTISYLMKNMLIFGIISIIVLFIMSNIIASWVMRPMEQAYEKQKQFISDAGHELKTPISTIAANSEILSRQLTDNGWLNNIIYENNRMSSIVTQLLDLARLENVKTEMVDVNLSELCFANVMPFEATAFDHGIDFNYDITDHISIMGDPTNLAKLISILTDNAISHCSSSGIVNFTLSIYNGKPFISVSNTGEAIPLEERNKIFERFYKSDSSRSEHSGHYGLGLSIAKSIVQTHKGKIEVDCTDGLVCFNVYFP